MAEQMEATERRAVPPLLPQDKDFRDHRTMCSVMEMTDWDCIFLRSEEGLLQLIDTVSEMTDWDFIYLRSLWPGQDWLPPPSRAATTSARAREAAPTDLQKAPYHLNHRIGGHLRNLQRQHMLMSRATVVSWASRALPLGRWGHRSPPWRAFFGSPNRDEISRRRQVFRQCFFKAGDLLLMGMPPLHIFLWGLLQDRVPAIIHLDARMEGRAKNHLFGARRENHLLCEVEEVVESTADMFGVQLRI